MRIIETENRVCDLCGVNDVEEIYSYQIKQKSKITSRFGMLEMLSAVSVVLHLFRRAQQRKVWLNIMVIRLSFRMI